MLNGSFYFWREHDLFTALTNFEHDYPSRGPQQQECTQDDKVHHLFCFYGQADTDDPAAS